MSVYLIVDTLIENADKYEEYKLLAKPIAEKYGGVYRVRGGDMDVLETDLWTPTRMVIIEFPDMDSARAFANSEEYAPVKPLRRENARCTLAILEGASLEVVVSRSRFAWREDRRSPYQRRLTIRIHGCLHPGQRLSGHYALTCSTGSLKPS